MNLKDTYNKIAEDWHKDHQEDDWWQEGTDEYISLIGKGGLVLDVGCASGIKSKYLAAGGLKVVGIDIADKLIDIARKSLPEAKFYVMDMADVENLADEFNGIFAQASLLHIPKKDIPDILKKLNSKLKPGGYFYVAVKQKEGVTEEIVKEKDYGYEYERFFSYFTLDEIENYFDELKMKIIRESVSPTRNNQWIQVIARKDVDV